MGLPSKEKRRVLAGRARAELAMRQASNLSCGEGAIFYDAMPKLDLRGRLLAGTGLSLYSSPVQSQLTVEEGAEIRIGDGVMLNFGADVYASRSIEIGDATMVGTMVSIMDTNFHPVSEGEATRKAPVKIGRNVWLGSSAFILPGVEIGDHSVVAAGSIVTRDVPPRSLVAGNPATLKRELQAADDWLRNAEPS